MNLIILCKPWRAESPIPKPVHLSDTEVSLLSLYFPFGEPQWPLPIALSFISSCLPSRSADDSSSITWGKAMSDLGNLVPASSSRRRIQWFYTIQQILRTATCSITRSRAIKPRVFHHPLLSTIPNYHRQVYSYQSSTLLIFHTPTPSITATFYKLCFDIMTICFDSLTINYWLKWLFYLSLLLVVYGLSTS